MTQPSSIGAELYAAGVITLAFHSVHPVITDGGEFENAITLRRNELLKLKSARTVKGDEFFRSAKENTRRHLTRLIYSIDRSTYTRFRVWSVKGGGRRRSVCTTRRADMVATLWRTCRSRGGSYSYRQKTS